MIEMRAGSRGLTKPGTDPTSSYTLDRTASTSTVTLVFGPGGVGAPRCYNVQFTIGFTGCQWYITRMS